MKRESERGGKEDHRGEKSTLQSSIPKEAWEVILAEGLNRGKKRALSSARVPVNSLNAL